ncbi:enoyl-CoA hydratase-related protein [Rhodococcus sp. 1168]|uniref:enoyl-CoA hydratase-related protein n=1 Tax=Rhodococcus sp. 1168 TaxID=2018041 RepID=UPI000A0E6345|nr:enoyl-CoA hydratase-related protein [Rhodococcus sp. 1168]ORI25493.1 hypothetical protein BJI47_02230 [Rhodococcus sp. 1168]
MTKPIAVERSGAVATIVLNRPDSRNALNEELSDQLCEAVSQLDADPDVRALVLTGAGRGFSSGMDLAEYTRNGVPASLIEFFQNGARMPLIAAIEGFAMAGGLELALRCDLIVAAQGSKLAFPESKVGLIAWYGASRVQRLISRQAAAELLFTGDPMTADRAYELGMITRLVDRGRARIVAEEMAAKIAGNAPLSVIGSKDLLDLTQGRTVEEYSRDMKVITDPVYSSSDSREGACAFIEKREAVWRGA